MENNVEGEERQCERSPEGSGEERQCERSPEGSGAAAVPDVRTQEDGGVVVSLFNDSAEQFISEMETVSFLCGRQNEAETFDNGEIQRFSSMVTFLKEWRCFCYEPKVVNFTYVTESPQVKEEVKGIKLPEFSSATVPEVGQSSGAGRSLNYKDFVLHAGGSVWALDWCPGTHERFDHPIKCEYLAVAAHPPDSSYHKIGSLLTGRGIVQIWCLLIMSGKDESYSERKRGKPRKKLGIRGSLGGLNVESKRHPPRPKGRPRKTALSAETPDNANNELKSTPPKKRGRPRKLPIEVEPSNVSDAINSISPPKRPRGRPRKGPDREEKIDNVDVSEDLSTMFIPALAVDDTHVNNTSSRCPRGRPRKTSDDTEKVDRLNAAKDLSNSEIIPYTATPPKRPRGRPRKRPDMNEKVNSVDVGEELSTVFIPGLAVDDTELHVKNTSSPKRPRGRPRKTSDETGKVDGLNCAKDLSNSEVVPYIALDDLNAKNTPFVPRKCRGRPRKKHDRMENVVIEVVEDQSIMESIHCHDANNLNVKTKLSTLKCNSSNDVLQGCHTNERISTTNSTNSCTEGSLKEKLRVVDENSCIHSILSMRDMESISSHVQDTTDSSHDIEGKRLLDDNNGSFNLRNVVALPRVVLCLGHNGKVAWDVKWKPHNIGDTNFRHRMGYLAVLLGNGSLEVWEVPCPSIVKNLYRSSFKEGMDPRFLKLHPVFRCSKLKFGDRQSIPLTMEWSRAAPSDLILVGCHDGTVALWKFSAEESSQDTRPLLCFTADTVPIRAVAWAPGESESESTNLIVTAGHEGLKFWDIRDPYRPLWDFYPAQRIILGLDWLQDPSCLIFSLDDGTLKTLSLWKAANDAPVTGKPFDGAKHGVVHNYYRSQFAVWSVQVSPITGVAAYCCADGSTLCFQITAKSVDQSKSRYRSPHFLCGAFVEIDHSLTIDTPIPHTEVPDLPRRTRGLPSHSNSALGDDPHIQGEDPTVSLGYGDFEPSPSRRAKSRTRKNEKAADEILGVDTLSTVGEDQRENLTIADTNIGQSNQNFLVFPPKIVAMHRVRWNINRGSEKWICYGGAAGIIRCREISLPSD